MPPLLEESGQIAQTAQTIHYHAGVCEMKSAKRKQATEAAPTNAVPSVPYLLFGQLPPNMNFLLARDEDGLKLGILKKANALGPHKFRGNAVTSLGGVMHIGKDIEVEPLQ